MHTANDRPSRNAASRVQHYNFTRKWGVTAEGCSGVDEQRHATSRGRRNEDMRRLARRERHCCSLGAFGSRTRPKEVILETGSRRRARQSP